MDTATMIVGDVRQRMWRKLLSEPLVRPIRDQGAEDPGANTDDLIAAAEQAIREALRS